MNPEYRKERIERLLDELRYEVSRGILEHEIDETINFQFVIPRSRQIPDGIVICEFRCKPVIHYEAFGFGTNKPKLTVVDKE